MLFAKFRGVLMDGKEVDTANYTAEEGSTVVTLKGSYVKTLTSGEHTVTILAKDGSTDVKLTVEAKPEDKNEEKPDVKQGVNTGDTFNFNLYFALFAAAIGLVAFAARKLIRD